MSFVQKPLLLSLILSGALSLGGCSDIARGVTEAVLETHGEQQDTRKCEIEGPAFNGVRESLEAQAAAPKTTKVLMVHGISSHAPGYSSRFQKKLYEKLGLSAMDATVKTIELDSSSLAWNPGEPHTLGTLRITRHMNAENTRQLLFYELTWSPITERQKKTLEADSANDQGLARANMNGSLKGFLNSTVPDLLIYGGNGYQKITTSVVQSVCWMLGNRWEDLPERGHHACEKAPHSTFSTLAADDHFFVTHSLGSRITVDTIQNFSFLSEKDRQETKRREIVNAIRDKEFTVFMLANQLPLLQVGRNAPEIYAEERDYCSAKAPKAASRAMRRMNVIAFSDPNDILSYPVPLDFSSNWIDSRICPSVTNVSLNVAAEKNLFDAVSFANPLAAHSGYMEDDRVIDLIADGLHHDRPVNRCTWQEYVTLQKDRAVRKPLEESLFKASAEED